MKFFENYSYRKKKVALLIVIVLLGAAAYKRAFSVTVEQLSLHEELKSKVDEAQNSVQTLKAKTLQLNQVNQVIGKENVPNEIVQHSFLSFVKNKDLNLSVNSIEKPHQYQHPDFIINTNKVTLKGDFLSTTSFIYNFETQFNLGRLVSVHVFKKRNRTTRKNEVLTTLYFQNFSD